MKSIILAAGPSSRLRPLTLETPKTLLEIEGKTILERIMDAQRACGIEEFAIVRGYKKEQFTIPNVTYYDNDKCWDTNILYSLMLAEDFMDDGFVVSYCDILYTSDVVQKLLNSPHDISIVVDTAWRERYEGRTDHPTDEAELAIVENGLVTHLSKFHNPDPAHGESIGLKKFSAKGAEILRRNYHRMTNNKWTKYTGRFHDATCVDFAYLTDMILELILRGYPIHSVDIQNQWVEMDTVQDFEYAKEMIKKGLL
ncbi:MAG: phosphocholine cytidylyltransferase family protein [Candidatus Hodarchaeales archaeon]|jgi:phosphoenolpyruvate phosphomutase